MDGRKGWFFFDRPVFKTLALATGTVLALSGSAFANGEACAKPPEPGLNDGAPRQWGGANVSADDRQKIADLFARYAWALDDRDADRFAALFIEGPQDGEGGSYTACSGGGSMQLYTANAANGTTEEIKMTIQAVFDRDKGNPFKPRHVLSNTLLRESGEDPTKLESKTTMVVLIQRSAGDHPLPEPDYTAEVRAMLETDTEGKWKFKSLTVYADTPVFEPRGR